jgi:dihydropteroate synthase
MEGEIEAIGRIVSRVSRLRHELDGLNDDLAHLGKVSQPPSRHLDCRGFLLPLGRRTLIMGVLNVTPDSFAGDGTADDPAQAIEVGRRMVADGADILDIGGESTRPGAKPVSAEEEKRRVVPVIEGLMTEVMAPISIDTTKPEVARAALAAGAQIVNDVNGLQVHPGLARLAAESRAPIVVMHSRGTPETMMGLAEYDDVVAEVAESLAKSVEIACSAGVLRGQVIVDPGIGFAKTVDHNLEIMRRLGEFKALGQPILVGTSRKSFIGRVLDLDVSDRLEGTAATVALAISHGADIVRVHDVKPMVRVARMTDAILGREWRQSNRATEVNG